MSGGDLDYAFMKVEQIAANVRSKATCSLHRTFSRHLVRVAEALKALEWTLSGDASPGSEVDTIKHVFFNGELNSFVEEAEDFKKDLENIIEMIRRKNESKRKQNTAYRGSF